MQCMLCEKVIRPGEPFSVQGVFDEDADVLRAPDGAMVPKARQIPVHFSCTIETIAGEVAATVLESIDDGEPSVRLKARGRSLSDKLYNLAERWIERSL